MKCSKCKYNNRVKANYCYKCGNKFTENEKKEAYSKTKIGKLEAGDDLINKLDFRNHKLYKIASLLVILITGLSYLINYGLSFKILESDNYKIKYFKENKEYYIISENKNVPINLYIPKKNQKVTITLYDKDNNAITKNEIEENSNIILNSNDNDSYYILKHNNQELKLIIVGGFYG